MRKRCEILVAFVAALSLILFVGCVKTDIDNGVGLVAGEEVECRLNLVDGAMEYGTATRSLDAATDDNEFEIENLWVIQFNSEGVVVGFPKYIRDFDAQTSTVTLLSPGSESNEILYLANTYNPNFSIQVKMTKAEVLSLSKLVEKVNHCVNFEGDEVRVMTSGMTSFTAADITSGSTLPKCTLKSGLAKISMKITKAASLTGFEIQSVQMKNVCNKLMYYYSDEVRNMEPSKCNYPLISDFKAIDYPYITEVDKEEYIFYVPMNCRGLRGNGNTDPSLKPHYAQPYDTFANIHVLVDGKPRDYKFYLGADLTADFNLKANHKYDYEITFNSAGECNTDTRIEDYSDFDYTQFPSANSYILNPSPTGDRVYTIPVAERVNDFWTNYNDNSKNLLNEESGWNCTLIWSDAESLVGSDGSTQIQFVQDTENPLAMKVTLPKGLNAGNYVVGVKKNGGSDYLWSWHFWVTDYRPSDVAKTLLLHPNLNQEYRYGVNGGEVHKYSTTTITSQDEILYIMDREIGARSIDYDEDAEGVLLYQFGRKDPFPKSTVPLIDGAGESTSINIETTNKMDYAVYHPNTFLTSNAASDVNVSDWEMSKESYKSNKIVWNDKKVAINDSGAKSIFDPSPHGWRIPEINVFTRASIGYGYLLKVYTGSDVSFYYQNKNLGPSVSPSNYLAKFTSYGYIDGSTGEYTYTQGQVNFWLSQPTDHSSYVGYGKFAKLVNSADGFQTSTGERTRACAIRIRPVFYAPDFTAISSTPEE